MLIHTEDLDTHVNLLRLVFDAHKEAGIRLNASKTHLFQEEVEYLGHLVNTEGVNPIPAGGDQFDPPCSFFYITQKVLV